MRSVPVASEALDRALVVMAKAPRPGRVKTRLTPEFTPEEAAALSAALLTDTLHLVRQLPRARVAIVCPRGDRPLLERFVSDGIAVMEQRGSGLADALASTFEAFASAGYRHVIAFDSDSPHIVETALEDAFVALETADLVVGPTDDGGYYLVGANASHDGLFETPVLGTSAALDGLTRRATELGLSVARGIPAYDVDFPADVARLAQELQAAPERARATSALLADWRHARRLP